LPPSVIVGKVGDVLPQDHLPRPGQLRGLLLAEKGLKPVNDLRQRYASHGPTSRAVPADAKQQIQSARRRLPFHSARDCGKRPAHATGLGPGHPRSIPGGRGAILLQAMAFAKVNPAANCTGEFTRRFRTG